MLLLRIIDTNQNNYFPQKVENLNFRKIHYGGASELNFKLNENPYFQNHKVGLFNNIYLYNFSKLIWQGYITEFQRDYRNLNYNLKASGLLIDFKNKKIKKTFVLDDIGEFKNWNEKNNKQSDEILYGYSRADEDKGIKISLLQRSYNAEEDGLFEIKIDENIERLKARILLNQPANFTTKLVTLDENHSNPYTEKSWANAKKIDEDVILDIVKTEIDKIIYTFGFSSDDGKWELDGATISGGFLEITETGWKKGGTRSPDVYWLSGANDDFIIEADFKQDDAVEEGMEMLIYLVGDDAPICFDLYHSLMRIHYKGVAKKQQSFTQDTSWHTAKIRRIGTILYFSIDSGAELSWNYGTKREISDIGLYIDQGTGKYDNFKYSSVYSTEEGVYIYNEKRYLQFRIECISNTTISTDKYFAQLENLKLLTSDDEINASNILKDLLLNHTQKLDLNTSLIQDCFNYKDIELCESLDGWNGGLNFSLENSIVKEGNHSIKTIVGSNKSYFFDFSFDNEKWTLNNATISGGVLDITIAGGYGLRYPDVNWLSGLDDDFIIEVDFKQDTTSIEGFEVRVYLVGDTTDAIRFDVRGSTDDFRIVYDGVLKDSTSFVDDTNWHTLKIRRVGTTYYCRIDSGSEISWNYGTERAIDYIYLTMEGCTGDYDNFKYSPVKNLTKTLSFIQNLQNKNLFRFWVRSTITGDILKVKFGENSRYQFEPEWSCQYEADQEPPNAEPAWTLIGTDYGSVSDGILTINKIAANTCVYQRTDMGHNVKGNVIITRMKCDNTGKTTQLILRDGIAGVVLAIYSTKIEDWYDAGNSYSIDMTKYRELWLTMKNNFWVLYIDGVFALCGETQITTDKYFRFGMDDSANLGKSYWDYVYYYNLGFLRNKKIEKIINITSNIYEFDFSKDDGKWNLDNAIITGGVLEITSSGGGGYRYPDTDWLSGVNDDFEIEVDFKQDSTDSGTTVCIELGLIGEIESIWFYIYGSEMYLDYDPALESQAYTQDISWHTVKIRRVGTIVYASIDGGTELSVDMVIARALDYIQLEYYNITGDFDNFKYYYKDAWQEKIIDLNNFPIETRDTIKYIQFEIATNSAFTFYIDWIRSNFELTSAYYRDRTAPLNILEDVLAYQDYEWTITKDRKVKFFEVDREAIDYICPIKNLVFEENSVSYFNKIYLVYFDEMMKRQEIELTDENSEIPFDKEHVIGLGGISDVGAKAIGEAQFSFHKKPRYQLSCSIDNFIFDKNGGRIKPVEIEPNNNVKFLGIKELPIFRIIKTIYEKGVCKLTLETEAETTPNIMKSIIEVL